MTNCQSQCPLFQLCRITAWKSDNQWIASTSNHTLTNEMQVTTHCLLRNTLWNKTSFKTVKKTHKYNNCFFFHFIGIKSRSRKNRYIPVVYLYSFLLVNLKPIHVMHKILFWHFLYFCGIKHKDYMNIHI